MKNGCKNSKDDGEFKNIGLYVKRGCQAFKREVTELHDWLHGRGLNVFIDQVTSQAVGINKNVFPREHIPEFLDMLIVMGGDGTIISAIRRVGRMDIPIFTINLGSLGFLADTTLEEMFASLSSILQSNYVIEERMMLKSRLYRDNELVSENRVLNDVVINKAAVARIITLQTYINDQYLASFKADGIIVSTPTGSTAYSLAAGGPILYPNMDNIIINPICPHMLTNRPLVIPDDSVIKLILDTAREEVFLSLDGQIGIPMKYRDVVLVTSAQCKIKLIKRPGFDHFEVLRMKLKWGER